MTLNERLEHVNVETNIINIERRKGSLFQYRQGYICGYTGVWLDITVAHRVLSRLHIHINGAVMYPISTR